MFGCPTVPKGWAACNGQLLPIMSNQALFTLLGTTYGGDGITNFALPNLQGAVPIHRNPSQYPQGQADGEAAHALALTEIPMHLHQAFATAAAGTQSIPSSAVMLAQRAAEPYGPATALAPMIEGTLGNTGTGAAHSNMQPYLPINICIALVGIYPSHS